MRKCKCGCGGEIKNNKWEYLRGHKPAGTALAVVPQQVAIATAPEAPEEESWTLSITLTDSQIYGIWQNLSAEKKAAAIQFALENR